MPQHSSCLSSYVNSKKNKIGICNRTYLRCRRWGQVRGGRQTSNREESNSFGSYYLLSIRAVRNPPLPQVLSEDFRTNSNLLSRALAPEAYSPTDNPVTLNYLQFPKSWILQGKHIFVHAEHSASNTPLLPAFPQYPGCHPSLYISLYP